MKHFLKIYFSTILLFLFIGLFWGIGYFVLNNDSVKFPSIQEIAAMITNDEIDENLTPIESAKQNSSRINVLLIGKEDTRTDTIMIVSYDKDNKEADILSIPRDTYYERDGFTNPQQKKINAVYQTEGIAGLTIAVENVIGIPIHNYVSVDYNAVVSIVDLLGGVEVYVPMDMYYYDPYDTPPLEININEGTQILMGEDALKLLRFRQNSDGTGYPSGDIGRIETQQMFINEAIKKAMGFKLPAVIEEAFNHIETDFKLSELLSLATSVVGFTTDDLELSIPEHYTKDIDGLSYVIINEEEIEKYVYDLYGVLNENVIENQ